MLEMWKRIIESSVLNMLPTFERHPNNGIEVNKKYSSTSSELCRNSFHCSYRRRCLEVWMGYKPICR